MLRRLRASQATSGIPVVIVSADATKSRIARLLDGGAKQYVTKPIDIVALMATIDEELAVASVG